MKSLITNFCTNTARLGRMLPVTGALLTSTVLVLSENTSAIAAALRVSYSGTVTEEVDGLLPPFGFTFLTEEEINDIFTLKPPSEPTTIEGFYTFDEKTNRVLFGQFQRITPTQKTTESFPFSQDERAQYDEVNTFSTADKTSARYGESFIGLDEFGSSGVSVDSQSFLYSADYSGLGVGNGETRIIGTIDQFAVEGERSPAEPGNGTNDGPDNGSNNGSKGETPEDPIEVPEPTTATALVLLASVGLWNLINRQRSRAKA